MRKVAVVQKCCVGYFDLEEASLNLSQLRQNGKWLLYFKL